MEEYRGSRNANGRMQDAYWVLMMEGSKVMSFVSLFVFLTIFMVKHLAFSLTYNYYICQVTTFPSPS